VAASPTCWPEWCRWSQQQQACRARRTRLSSSSSSAHAQQQHHSRPSGSLAALLHTHQRRRQPPSAEQPAPADTLRLQRKLTSVLRDSAASGTDVADVLLVAEAAGCLNALHVAAALATLVRLQAAEAAADEVAAAAAWDGPAGSVRTVAVVPMTAQQHNQMATVSAAAAAAQGGGSSRWHAPAAAAAAADKGDGAAAEYMQLQHLLPQLALAVQQLWPGMSAATITSCCWSMAVLQVQPPDDLLHLAGEALLAMAASLDNSSSSNATAEGADQAAGASHHRQQQHLQASPRQVVVVMWALAKLTSDPHEVLPVQQQQQGPNGNNSSSLLVHQLLSKLAPHMQQLTSQGLLLMLWAAATWSSSSECQPGVLLPAPTASALLAACEAALHSQALAPRGLTVVLWACAHLRLCPPPAWLAAWLAAMHAALPGCDAQDVALGVWALARLGCPPPSDWLAAAASRAGQLAARMGCAELPALCWALGRLRYRPPAHVVAALLQRGARLASQGALSPQGLALLLWTPALLQVELPGRWLDGVLASAGGFLPLFRPREASCLLVSLARLGHIPPPAWMEVWWAGSSGLLAAAHGRQLVLLLWAAVRLGQAPPRAWLGEWLDACAAAMGRAEVSAQGFGVMWEALAQLMPAPTVIRHTSWWDAYWEDSCQPGVLQGMTPLAAERTLAGLAAAAAASHWEADAASSSSSSLAPPAGWLRSFLDASHHLLPGANLYNIANMLQAAAQLELQLPPLWLGTAMARLQRLLAAHGVLQARDSRSRSLALSARLQRRWLEACLRRVLPGLRAQQLLTPAPQRRLWHAAMLAAGTGAAAAPPLPAAQHSSDVLSVWPWLSAAVHNTWPDSASARQALEALCD
jgi:hypothetical protein